MERWSISPILDVYKGDGWLASMLKRPGSYVKEIQLYINMTWWLRTDKGVNVPEWRAKGISREKPYVPWWVSQIWGKYNEMKVMSVICTYNPSGSTVRNLNIQRHSFWHSNLSNLPFLGDGLTSSMPWKVRRFTSPWWCAHRCREMGVCHLCLTSPKCSPILRLSSRSPGHNDNGLCRLPLWSGNW